MSKKRSKLPFVLVASRLKSVLQQGHPWVYGDAIERAPAGLESGTWVRVQCANLQFFGLWDADSPIAVRIFSSRQRPNRAWVIERVRQAWDLRAPLRDPVRQTSAYRWLYGESDGLPGIVVDLYGDVESDERWAVLKTYAASLERIVPWVVEALNLAREALVREPWQEQATRLGMEACLALDDRAGALRLYRALAERLQKELGIEPGEDLREFYARVAAAGRL
ncbi:MAG TPA: hypothetical protein G4N94_10310 [Caldilineae bacterium]|nr:hypothetical protein [Caldilineae bacterium]